MFFYAPVLQLLFLCLFSSFCLFDFDFWLQSLTWSHPWSHQLGHYQNHCQGKRFFFLNLEIEWNLGKAIVVHCSWGLTAPYFDILFMTSIFSFITDFLLSILLKLRLFAVSQKFKFCRIVSILKSAPTPTIYSCTLLFDTSLEMSIVCQSLCNHCWPTRCFILSQVNVTLFFSE